MSKKTIRRFITILLLLIAVISGGYFIRNHFTAKPVDLTWFSDDFKIAKFENQKVCLFNEKNGRCVSPKVDYIHNQHLTSRDSLVLFSNDKKTGYLNRFTGEIVIPAVKFDEAFSFDSESGLAAVVINGKMGFINSKGNFVIDPTYKFNKYENYDYVDFVFSDGYCFVPDSNGHIGVISVKNELVMTCDYKSFDRCADYWVFTNHDEKMGVADCHFNVVVEPVHFFIDCDERGIIVSNEELTKQQLVSFDGKTIIVEHLFDDISKIYSYQGLEEEETGYSKYYMHWKVGLLDDKTGKVITPPLWNSIEYHSKGLFVAWVGEYCFLINSNGEIIQ